ncbi:MAG: hypothetical protein ACHP78_14145 [Terriglobales bacterium]
MTSIGHHFYSKRSGFAILALAAIIASLAFAQSKKKEKGPRALAVVELPADGKSKPRLIPIAILVDGRFWDASIYLADPRPMALDPGNVYEVERSGKPLGFFTVGEALQVKDRWIGLGDYKPESEKPPAAAKSAKPRSAEDDERPVLHKRQSTTAEPETPSAPQSSSPAAAPVPPPPPPDDPNRPVLRRGKPKPQPQEEVRETGSPSKPQSAPPAATAKVGEVLPAISDAGGPEPRPYAYVWAPDEQPKLTKAVSDIATAEVARYVKNTPALRFAPAATLDHVVVRAFDLHYDNTPEIVFMARVPAVVPPASRTRTTKPSQPAPNFFFYVTVVGQTDLYGQMRKLFSSVTDSARLDVFPRLELIDAVDAEGTGRGDLLFRAASDTPSYQLYHVGPDSLRKLFDSAGE